MSPSRRFSCRPWCEHRSHPQQCFFLVYFSPHRPQPRSQPIALCQWAAFGFQNAENAIFAFSNCCNLKRKVYLVQTSEVEFDTVPFFVLARRVHANSVSQGYTVFSSTHPGLSYQRASERERISAIQTRVDKRVSHSTCIDTAEPVDARRQNARLLSICVHTQRCRC